MLLANKIIQMSLAQPRFRQQGLSWQHSSSTGTVRRAGLGDSWALASLKFSTERVTIFNGDFKLFLCPKKSSL